MTGTGFGLLAAMAVVTGFLIWQCWRQDAEIARLRSRHAKPRADAAAASVRPAPADTEPVPVVRTSLLSAPARHADAMHRISEPFMPELPVGRHAEAFPRYSNSRADLPVVPVETGDAPPWDISTAQQDAVPGDVQAMRREYIAARFRERDRAALRITTGFMRKTVAQSRELPVYGEAPQLDVAEAERLNQVMMP